MDTLIFSPEADQLNKALFALQCGCDNLPKRHTAKVETQKGPGFSYKFTSIADVRAFLKPHLQAHGLLVVQPPCAGEIVTRVIHVASGQWIEGRMAYPAAERNAQALGGAITYVRRFALLATLGLAGEDDDDDGAAAARAAESPSRQRTQRPPQRAAAEGPPAQMGSKAANLIGMIDGATSWAQMQAALKVARDNLQGDGEALAAAERSFEKRVLAGLEAATTKEQVDTAAKVASDARLRNNGPIVAAIGTARERIAGGCS